MICAVVASLGALATIGSVVALRARAPETRRHRSWAATLVPWELGLVGLVVVSYQRLGTWGAPVSRGAGVTRVDVVGLLFPVLFLVAIVAVLARLLLLSLGPLRAASDRWSMPLFLAVRRVATARAAAIALVAASAVAAGVLGYAATLTRSLSATLEVKASTLIGSDVAVRLPPDQDVPPALSDVATEVDDYNDARLAGDDERVFVMAVDPATFEQAAFWDASFASSSLDDLLALLDPPSGGGPIPALALGDLPASVTVELGRGDDSPLEVEAVAEPRAFPGMATHRPTLVVAASALPDSDVSPSTEVWIRGDRDRILGAFEASGTGFVAMENVGDVVDQVSFLTVSWTFGFLQSLGVVAGVLALGGLVVYLDARRRGRVLGYSFARRMGLTRSAHRRALLVELVATVVVGCWLGLVVSVVGARLAYDQLDPVPRLPPEPVLRVATGLMLLLGLAAMMVAGLGALLAQRRADRDDPLEVLRAGT